MILAARAHCGGEGHFNAARLASALGDVARDSITPAIPPSRTTETLTVWNSLRAPLIRISSSASRVSPARICLINLTRRWARCGSEEISCTMTDKCAADLVHARFAGMNLPDRSAEDQVRDMSMTFCNNSDCSARDCSTALRCEMSWATIIRLGVVASSYGQTLTSHRRMSHRAERSAVRLGTARRARAVHRRSRFLETHPQDELGSLSLPRCSSLASGEDLRSSH